MEEERKLPGNIRQIGSADPTYTVYVEDYVETYIRKQKRTEKKPVVTGYLYGRTLTVDGESKCLIYGAIEDGRMTKERGRTKGEKFFPEYKVMGWFVKGDRDKLPSPEEQNRLTDKLGLVEGAVLYIGDGENGAMLSLRGGTLFPLSGHMIFYERNEAMQEFMVQTGDGKSIETETVDEAALHFREIMQKNEPVLPAKTARRRAGSGGLVKAASMLAVVLLGGSLIFAGNEDMRQEAFAWIQDLTKEKETESDIAVNVIQGEVEPTESEPAETESPQTNAPETQPQESQAPETTPAATNPPETNPPETNPPETTSPATNPPETNPPETVPVVTGTDHVVVAGETLHGILKMYYGSESRLGEICQINSIANPDEIFAGQVIHLP